MPRPNIFKANIAKIINKQLGPLVFDLTLIKKTAGTRGTNPTAGTTPTSTSVSAKGFVDSYKQANIDGTIVRAGDRKIVILGDSLPVNTEPAPPDQITIEGRTWTVVNVDRDPAGATYECQSR